MLFRLLNYAVFTMQTESTVVLMVVPNVLGIQLF